MANKAGINSGISVIRSAARMERIKQALAKAQGRNQGERVISLQAELERRQEELRAVKASLDAALK